MSVLKENKHMLRISRNIIDTGHKSRFYKRPIIDTSKYTLIYILGYPSFTPPREASLFQRKFYTYNNSY